MDKLLEVIKNATNGDLTQEIRTDERGEPIDLVCASLKEFLAGLRVNMQAIAKSIVALASSADELTTIGQQWQDR